MGKSSGSQQTSSAEPWAGVQPYLTELFANASGLLGTGGPKYYPGQNYVDPSAATQQGWQSAMGAANQMNSLLGMSAPAYQSMLSAPDVENNKYAQSAIRAAMNPISENLMQNVLPGIQDQAYRSGAYGGTKMEQIEGDAIKKATAQMGDTASQMSLGVYNSGLNSQAQAMGMIPQLMQSMAMPSSIYSGVGKSQEGYDTTAMKADQERWNYNQNQPYDLLNWYSNLLNGMAGFGTKTTSSSAQNPMADIIGLLMASSGFMK